MRQSTATEGYEGQIYSLYNTQDDCLARTVTLNKTQLRERGWTDALIRRLLPEPTGGNLRQSVPPLTEEEKKTFGVKEGE